MRTQLLLLLSLTSIASSTTHAQGRTGPPVPPLLSSSDSGATEKEKAKREARGKLFNIPRPRHVQPPGAPPPITFVHRFAHPEMPVSESDTIVVGEVTGLQVFESENKAGLYTEYSVGVREVVKAPSALVAEAALAVFQRGGEAVLANGQVKKHVIVGESSPPRIGEQNLMFLRYDASVDGYWMVKLWTIKDGKLNAASPEDIARVGRSESEYQGKPLAQVLLTIKAIVDQR